MDGSYLAWLCGVGSIHRLLSGSRPKTGSVMFAALLHVAPGWPRVLGVTEEAGFGASSYRSLLPTQ